MQGPRKRVYRNSACGKRPLSTLSQAKFGSALVFTSEPNRFPRNLEFHLNFPRLPSRSLRETMDNTKVRAEVTLSVGHPFARGAAPRFM